MMLLSKMIESLQQIHREHGDIKVTTGLDRSGYGEVLLDITVTRCLTVGNNQQPELVVDLIVDDETAFETMADGYDTKGEDC